jgi:hypothetical protein
LKTKEADGDREAEARKLQQSFHTVMRDLMQPEVEERGEIG